MLIACSKSTSADSSSRVYYSRVIRFLGGERMKNTVENSVEAASIANRSSTPTPTTSSRSGTAYPRSSSICAENVTPGEIQGICEHLSRTRRTPPRPLTMRSLDRRQKMTLVSLAVVDFASFCSMSVMAPFFPKEAEAKGMPESLSGLVFGFYAAVMFVSAPVFGIILPRIGAKFLFIAGLTVAGVCNVLFGFLDAITDYTAFVSFCFLIRGLEALGASAFSTASHVFVVDTFPDNTGAVLGILETFVGLGMSTGPAIGGLLYSVGGFGLPFYALGGLMVAVTPVNFCMISAANDRRRPSRIGGSSLAKLLKLPAVLVIGSVVVVASGTWSFLDPTLEPHLRQYHLTTGQVGLVFLLFSALYGISSPLWGWLADKTNSHWSMMAVGLAISSAGLAVLGPTALLPFIPNSLRTNILALCTLGVSVSLTLLPTFPSILTSAVRGGCADDLSTYSIVAGLWSCIYSLGEVVGPSLGGLITERYGFQMCSTVMAGLSFSLAVFTTLFFSLGHGVRGGNGSNSGTSRDSGIQTSGSLSCSGSSQARDEETSRLLQTSPDHGDVGGEKTPRYRANNIVDRETGVTDFRGTAYVGAYGACDV